MNDPQVRQLSSRDVPALYRLKETAGWNQTEFDLKLLFLLEPAGLFGIERNGVLMASAGFVTYGTAMAWVGMVLTAPEARRQGLARILINRCLAELEERQVEWIGLDATAMGKPLYEEVGFRAETVIERWRRDPPHRASSTEVAPFVFDAALDYRAFGADRTALVAALAQQGSASVPGFGYACGRAGATAAFFGPCLATNSDAAANLVEWFLASHPHEVVFWDLLHSNPEALRLASAYGFSPLRTLWRMWRPGVAGGHLPVREDRLIFGTAGFEFG